MSIDNTKRKLIQGTAAVVAGILLPGQAFTKILDSSSKRKLALYNIHTNEDLEVTYWRNGFYQERAVARINELLRDHRSEEVMAMDLNVIDQIYAIQRKVRNNDQVKIISAYRSKASNEELRQKRRGVAKKSYHILGRAVDICIPGCSLAKQRKVALRLSAGGVGYYRRGNFIHLDSGPVRAW